MSRQIKFRIFNGSSMEYKVMAGYLGHFYVAGMSDKDAACMSEFNTIYNEATPLMQWTGLYDEMGKEIYEGDVIKFENSNLTYEVRFDNGGFIAYHTDFLSEDRLSSRGHFFMPYQWDVWEKKPRTYVIIGNIHQNPKLLTT